MMNMLAGYYRRAVGLKEELDVRNAWIGDAALAQADKMEEALTLNNPTTKVPSTAFVPVNAGPHLQYARKEQASPH